MKTILFYKKIYLLHIRRITWNVVKTVPSLGSWDQSQPSSKT